jgi:hypothetical protein
MHSSLLLTRCVIRLRVSCVVVPYVQDASSWGSRSVEELRYSEFGDASIIPGCSQPVVTVSIRMEDRAAAFSLWFSLGILGR